MGTLSITGRSEIKVHPEMTVLTIVIDGITDDYQKSMKENTGRAKEIKDIITSNKIPKDDIKSLDFWVKEDWSSWWDKDKEKYKRKFNGYKYHQRLLVKFPNDNAVLSNIVYRTSTLEKEPSIDVRFITEKQKDYECQILSEAMKDALMKAETLASAGGFELVSIDDITTDDFRSINDREVCCNRIMSDGCVDSFDIDLEPEDYLMEREIEVVWNIK